MTKNIWQWREGMSDTIGISEGKTAVISKIYLVLSRGQYEQPGSQT